jgi:kinesin family member C2/C3
VMGTKAHPEAEEKAVGKARRVSMTPVMRQIPLQPKRRASMAILPSLSEQLSSVHAGKRASRLSHLQMPRSSIAFPGAAARAPAYVTPDGREEKIRRFDFGGSSSKFSSPTMMDKLLKRNNVPSTPQQRVGLPPGPANASKLCFSVQKRVQISPLRAKPGAPSGAGIFNRAPRDKGMVVGRAGNALRVLNPKRRQSVI